MSKIKPKYEALADVKRIYTTVTYKGQKRFYERWQADCGTRDGKRIRIAKRTKQECQRAVAEWYATVKSCGSEITSLSPRQIREATYIYSLLAEKHIRESLETIVQDYIRRKHEVCKSIPISEAYGIYYAKFGDQQEAQKEFVRGRVGRFSAKFGDRLVCDVTAAEIKAYLDSFDTWSASTWNGHMDYIKAFFNWCAKKANSYCAENPIVDMERKAVKSERPQCATPEDVRTVFAATLAMDGRYRDLMLLRMTLAFFCGMRTAEILRQKFEDIMLDEGTIIVTEAKGEQSGGVGRAFKIPDTAKAWLQTVDIARAKATVMSDTSFMRWRKIVFDNAGVKMPDNAGRHSFISYHVALYGNPRLTEGIVGTGDAMRKRHYDARVTHKAAEEYFSILPQTDEQEGKPAGVAGTAEG